MRAKHFWQWKVWTHREFQRHNGDLFVKGEPEMWREKRKVRIFGKGKCIKAHRQLCDFLARESVNSAPILARQWWRHFRLSLSLCISLSLSHRKYLTHNIGSASALPIICETNDRVCLSSVAQQCKCSRCSRPGAGSSERSARTILAADWDTPKDILFRQLDWPSLRWRRTILSMTLFHQLVHRGEEPLMECMFQWGVCIMAAHSNRWLLRGRWFAGQSVRCCFPVFGKELTVSFALALGRFFPVKDVR